MAYNQSVKSAIELLFALNGAMVNVRLYPPDSNIVKSVVLRIHQEITSILMKMGTIEFSIENRRLMVQGNMLSEKSQGNPRISAFTDMMLDLGVNRIILKKGVDEKELADFFQIIKTHSEQLFAPGSLALLMKQQGIVNISAGEAFPEEEIADELTPAEEKAVLPEDTLSRITKADYEVFKDPGMLVLFPDVFKASIADGNNSLTDMFLKRFEEAVTHKDPDIRKSVAALMVSLDEKLVSFGHNGLRFELAKIICSWIQRETVAFPEMVSASERMANFSCQLIRSGHKEKARKIIVVFHRMAIGALEKNEAKQTLAEQMLQRMTEEEILFILLKDSPKEGRSGAKEDIYSLVMLGSRNMDRILDRLRDSRVMSERNRILQIIEQIGSPAIPSIFKRLEQKGPWYYTRNLVLLLGRLGDESLLPALETYLNIPDYRIQREVIRAIQSIGGARAGRILHDNFDHVDQQLHPYIISMIGALEYKPAIPKLIELLSDSMPSRTSSEREEIREKACEALGRMKAEQAVSALEKIIRKRGFFRKENPEIVRYAAAKALGEIKSV